MSTDASNYSRKNSVLVTTREKSAAFIEMYAGKEYLIFSINGAEISSKEEFLTRLAREMRFPDYFGNNWDALEECLKDLNWLSANGYIIRFANADKFIKDHLFDFRIFVEIVESVGNYWKGHKIEFVLIAETNDPFLAI
jgi:RNAse (barnase) inhibitor barstar